MQELQEQEQEDQHAQEQQEQEPQERTQPPEQCEEQQKEQQEEEEHGGGGRVSDLPCVGFQPTVAPLKSGLVSGNLHPHQCGTVNSPPHPAGTAAAAASSSANVVPSAAMLSRNQASVAVPVENGAPFSRLEVWKHKER